jgi:hypothetical protein
MAKLAALRQSKFSDSANIHVITRAATTLGAETHIQKSILNPKEPQPRFFARHSHPRSSFALDDKVSTPTRISLNSYTCCIPRECDYPGFPD